MTSSVDSSLAERGEQYGLFIEGAALFEAIASPMTNHKAWEGLAADQRYTILMIAMKLARALNGNPDNLDNWHDIQGYAKLVEDRLLGRGAYAKLGDVQSSNFGPCPDCGGPVIGPLGSTVHNPACPRVARRSARE